MSLLIKRLPNFVPPVYGCWAILQAVNIAAIKPATVRRNWEGTDFVIDCYITQHVRDEWVAGHIAIGDYVLVEYLDRDPDRAGVVAKIVKTW